MLCVLDFALFLLYLNCNLILFIANVDINLRQAAIGAGKLGKMNFLADFKPLNNQNPVLEPQEFVGLLQRLLAMVN